MKSDVLNMIQDCKQRLIHLKQVMHYEDKLKRLSEIEQQLSSGEVWSDPQKAQVLAQEQRLIKGTTEPIGEIARVLHECEEFLNMASDGSDDALIADLQKKAAEINAKIDQMETRAFFTGPYDNRDCYLTVQAGAGGTDACDWAEMLIRMYTQFCDRQKFSANTVEISPNDEGGIRSATLLIKGDFAYGMLRAEMGVHRLVRISPYNASHKRQTSFAAVDVMPLMDDIRIEIKEQDLKLETFKSGGAGGQYVNKTESAVRITHIPTGIVVQCQSERNQQLNRKTAMSMLAAKLYRLEEMKRDKEIRSLCGERGEITFGRQIRSYTLHPFQLVKDHRTGFESSQVQDVLDGHLEDFIYAYHRWRNSQAR